jgi:hypothetical protein
MNKKIILSEIFLLIIIFSLSGCFDTQQDIESEENRFELVSYYVESWKNGYEGLEWNEYIIENGFFHSDNVDEYRIKGIIRNNGRYRAYIEIIMNFYDRDETFLDSFSLYINILPDNYEKDFSAIFDKNDLDHWDKIESVKFELKEY